jgi:hypothetical protein
MRSWLRDSGTKTLRYVCRKALRVMVTGLIFTAVFWGASLYLGLPVPSPSELLDKFKDVSKLAEVLS